MPGTTNHDRQYTSTYYIPFRFYSQGTTTFDNANIIDLSSSESANNNEILVLPFKAASIVDDKYVGTTDTVNIDVYAYIPLQTKDSTSGEISTSNTWVKIGTIKCTDGAVSSVSPLYATYYKLVPDSVDYVLNVSNNDVNVNGSQSYIVQQTYPKVAWSGLVYNANYSENDNDPVWSMRSTNVTDSKD